MQDDTLEQLLLPLQLEGVGRYHKYQKQRQLRDIPLSFKPPEYAVSQPDRGTGVGDRTPLSRAQHQEGINFLEAQTATSSISLAKAFLVLKWPEGQAPAPLGNQPMNLHHPTWPSGCPFCASPPSPVSPHPHPTPRPIWYSDRGA